MLDKDAIDFVNGLDPEEIRARIDELESQSRALRVLLRSALARQANSRHLKNVSGHDHSLPQANPKEAK
jgi:hypothetical protein